MTTLSVPMAVISSPPITAVCVGPDPAATCRVWLGNTIPVGPSVTVWPLTTTTVGVGSMVKTVPSIVATEEGPYTTPIPPTVVVIGSGGEIGPGIGIGSEIGIVPGIGIGAGSGVATDPGLEGGRVRVTPAPITLDGSITKVSVSTITIDVFCAGLSVNV